MGFKKKGRKKKVPTAKEKSSLAFLKKKTAHPIFTEMSQVTDGVDGFTSMADAPPIEVVPSLLAGFNRAIGHGGIPLETISIVHGPTHGGKTVYSVVIGVLSFQCFLETPGIPNWDQDSRTEPIGLPYFIDAERAADVKLWFTRLGVKHDWAMILRPTSYEEVMRKTVQILENVRKVREQGIVPPTRKFSLIIDSLDKCFPESIRTAYMKLKPGSKKDTLPRQAGMEKARLNKDFFNMISPMIADQPIAIIIIAHESEQSEGFGQFKKKKFHVKGGNHILYDARCQYRVKFIGFDNKGSKDNPIRIAKRHNVSIVKNKVGFPGTSFNFYTATREGADRGVPWLDLGRTLMEEAMEMHVVQPVKGGRFHYDGKNRWREQWIDGLNTDRDFYQQIWNEVASAQQEIRERDHGVEE